MTIYLSDDLTEQELSDTAAEQRIVDITSRPSPLTLIRANTLRTAAELGEVAGEAAAQAFWDKAEELLESDIIDYVHVWESAAVRAFNDKLVDLA